MANPQEWAVMVGNPVEESKCGLKTARYCPLRAALFTERWASTSGTDIGKH